MLKLNRFALNSDCCKLRCLPVSCSTLYSGRSQLAPRGCRPRPITRRSQIQTKSSGLSNLLHYSSPFRVHELILKLTILHFHCRIILKFSQRFQAAISSIERCSQPVIAAINGVAFGLAVDIVAACDVRYAATSTQFSIKVRTLFPSILSLASCYGC